MSDLSTREQIRAEAVDRMARWQHDIDYAKYPQLDKLPWGEMSQAQRESYRAAVRGLVDALGDLLPTGIEWGVRYESVDYPPRMSNPSGVSTNTRVLDGGEMHARAAVANGAPIDAENRRVVSRYSHDWIEVSE